MSLEALLSWAQDQGVVVTNVEFEQTQNEGLGAFAEDLDSPSSIYLPVNAIITPELARGHIRREVSSSSILMKTLIALWSKNDSVHNFKPYFELLPSLSDIGSPLTLSDEFLEVYRGTNLNAGSIHAKLEQLKGDYAEVEDLVSFDEYLWAHLIVTSRAFPYNIINKDAQLDEVMLLPLVDLLNHKPKADVEWLSIVNDEAVDGFKLQIANQAHSKSEARNQLWNNYGPKGNEELLMGYGFVIKDNQFDLLHLTINLPKDLLAKVKSLDIELTSFNHYTNEKVSNEGESEGTVFIVNNFHPLPRGLVECFALSSAAENKLKLSNVLNGIQDLKSMLKLKFKGKLDIMPKKPEEMSSVDYQKASDYRQGQLKMYNLLMQKIKDLERSLLKTYKQRLRKCKNGEEAEEQASKHLLYIREGKPPLLVDDVCIDDSSEWYSIVLGSN